MKKPDKVMADNAVTNMKTKPPPKTFVSVAYNPKPTPPINEIRGMAGTIGLVVSGLDGNEKRSITATPANRAAKALLVVELFGLGF